MAYTFIASSCPAPQVPGAMAKISDFYHNTKAQTLGHAYTITGGDATSWPSKFNANAQRIDTGGGAYVVPMSILTGLVLSIGSGLSVNYTAGYINSGGVVEFAAGSKAGLTANATNRLWAKADGTIAATVSNSLPATGAIFLGFAITGSSTVTSLDFSGVVYAVNGVLERNTADLGCPTDTPPATWRGWTIGADGVRWWWSGTQYEVLGGMPGMTETTVTAGQTRTIPAGFQTRVKGDFRATGNVRATGDLIVEER